MAAESTVELIGDCVSIVVVGEISKFEDILSYWVPARVRANEAGLTRFLIDYRKVDFRLDYFGMVQLSKHAEAIKFQYNKYKIAVVVLPKDYRVMLDYQTPAFNRGFRYHPFVDKNQALAWLREG